MTSSSTSEFYRHGIFDDPDCSIPDGVPHREQHAAKNLGTVLIEMAADQSEKCNLPGIHMMFVGTAAIELLVAAAKYPAWAKAIVVAALNSSEGDAYASNAETFIELHPLSPLDLMEITQ